MSEKDIYSKGKDGLDVPGMGLTRANVEPLDGSGMEKERGYDQDDIEYNKRLAALGLDPNTNTVKRELRERHLSMIAIGGTIGTGLFVGSGSALATGGPLGVWLSYIIMGSGVYAMMVALGEMSTLFPVPSAITHLASRFVDPAMGFALGWNYWYSWAITTPVELAAIAIIMQYWTTTVHPAVWISIFFVLICLVNFLGVRWYGESEFWFSSIKVVAIIGLIIMGIVLDLGGGPRGDRIGFRYWKDPGLFNYITINGGNDIIPGSKGQFLAFWSTFVTSAFSFIGTEIVAVTVGEAANPRRAVPRAIRRMKATLMISATSFSLPCASPSILIAFFAVTYPFNSSKPIYQYVLGILVIALLVPYNDPRLLGGDDASASPFVLAAANAGVKVVPHIVNAVVLVAAWSAGNSDVYAASRTLYALALQGKAPAFLKKCTKAGLPWTSIAVTCLFGPLAYMGTSSGTVVTIFNWFYNLSAITGLIAWCVILGAYLRFFYGARAQGIDRRDFPYRAPFQPYLSWFGFIFFILVVLFNGFTVFLKGNWDTSTFFSAYISLPIFALCYFGWKFAKKTQWVRVSEMDFMTGRRELDEIDAFEQEKHKPKAGWWNKAVAIVF